MPEYRRAFQPGGMFFFTVVTYRRRPLIRGPTARRVLRRAIRTVQDERRFDLCAMVLLPDHLHCLWELPPGDADFSIRWSQIKRLFSKEWIADGGEMDQPSPSRRRHRESAIWQRRFWEHTIRDEADFIAHMDYIHYNPVRHGLASCPHAWPFSSFSRWVRNERYAPTWNCVCDDRRPTPPDFSAIEQLNLE